MEQLRPTASYESTLPREALKSFPSGENRGLNKFFKALADETRRNILRLLETGERSVGEIVDNFELSQPTISRHLSVLKEADLVLSQRQGQRVIYRLNGEALANSAERFFSDFRPLHQRFR